MVKHTVGDVRQCYGWMRVNFATPHLYESCVGNTKRGHDDDDDDDDVCFCFSWDATCE